MIVEIAKNGISCPHCDLGPLFSNYLLVNSNGNETAFNFLKIYWLKSYNTKIFLEVHTDVKSRK